MFVSSFITLPLNNIIYSTYNCCFPTSSKLITLYQYCNIYYTVNLIECNISDNWPCNSNRLTLPCNSNRLSKCNSYVIDCLNLIV